MKKLFVLFVFSLTILSCQNEENEVIDNSQAPANLVANSPLVGLLSRTTQNPTALDNVLDSSSCFSVQLPVTVIVNGNNIVVSSQENYQAVQDAIDAFSNDDDIVNFVYPITIQFQNFSTQVLTDSDDLDDVLDDCGEDDDFDEIDCISINYPIVVNVYDASNQIANSITITSNLQLFNFIVNLTPQSISSIVYPISVTNANGQNVVINSNSALQDFIENSIDDCDDNSSGGGNDPILNSVVTTGNWRITYSFDEGNQTSSYNGYVFTFNTSGTATAVKNGITINGTWSTFVDSGQTKFVLSFDGEVLDEIEEDWNILEFSQTTLVLKHISGGNGGTDYLTFTKN